MMTMQKEFIIEDSVWGILPDLQVAIVVGHSRESLNQGGGIPEDLLKQANQKAVQWVKADPISANPIIKDWRDVFHKFKTKRGARSSVESLLKRAKQGKGVGNINNLVDIYNSVSLEKAFPIGGLDLERLQGDLTLRVSAGGEKFFPIGEQDAEMTLPQEIIYSDRRAVVTRCLNWRDSARYGVNPSTKEVLFIIENANPERNADYQQAIVLLQKRLQDYLKLSTTVQVLDQEHPQVEL